MQLQTHIESRINKLTEQVQNDEHVINVCTGRINQNRGRIAELELLRERDLTAASAQSAGSSNPANNITNINQEE